MGYGCDQMSISFTEDLFLRVKILRPKCTVCKTSEYAQKLIKEELTPSV